MPETGSARVIEAAAAQKPSLAGVLEALAARPGLLETVAAGAAERDRTAQGIEDAMALVESAGALAVNAVPGTERPPAAKELALVRMLAWADSSLGRVFDGHLNGVERLAVQAPAELAQAELSLVRDGLLRVGVWGGDPRPGEGEPARVQRAGVPRAGAQRAGVPGAGVHPSEVLTGVKTFCSGAGTLDRALILARSDESPAPVMVWIDLSDADTVSIDETWYRSSGLRASASHRVVFDSAPVLARVGGPGDITAQPWFGRDALRTAASWAGMADRAVELALDELAARPGLGLLEELAAGRMLGAQRTISAWLDTAAGAMDRGAADLWDVALHGRVAIAAGVREILDEAARACGSHPFATGGDLDRVRRDLELFVLQHRLEPGIARSGAAALGARAGAAPLAGRGTATPGDRGAVAGPAS